MWLGGKALVIAGFAAFFVAVSLFTRYVARWIPDSPLKRVLYRDENDPPPVPGSPEHEAGIRWHRSLQWYFVGGVPALMLLVYWAAGGSFTDPF